MLESVSTAPSFEPSSRCFCLVGGGVCGGCSRAHSNGVLRADLNFLDQGSNALLAPRQTSRWCMKIGAQSNGCKAVSSARPVLLGAGANCLLQ